MHKLRPSGNLSSSATSESPPTPGSRARPRGSTTSRSYSTNLDKTIEFYTQVIRLKMLRVRAHDEDPRSTQVFFDMGRGELLAFLRVNDMKEKARLGLGGFHHAALTVTREQYQAAKKRLDERGIKYSTISHEILDTITLTDPNGITLELSVWNVDPKDVQM